LHPLPCHEVDRNIPGMSTLQPLPTEQLPSRETPRRGLSCLLQGVVFNWGSLVIFALVSIVLTPIMIRHLGQYYYGMWMLIMSLVDQYGLLDMGMGTALSRFAGYFQGAEQRNALDEVFSTSLAFTLLIGVCVCLITLFVALLLPPFFGFTGPGRPTFMRLVLLLGLTTAVAFPERMMSAYLRGIQRFDLPNIVSTSAVIVRGLLVLAAFWYGYGVLCVAAITLIVGIASLAAHYAMIYKADPLLSVRRKNVRKARLRELFSFSIYVFIASVGTRLTSRVDSIVIARILTVADITPFSIGSRLMDYFSGVLSGVHGPVMSAMCELHGRSEKHEFQKFFVRSSKVTLMLSFLLGSLLVFNGQALLSLWLGKSGMDLKVTYRILVILTSCYVAFFAQLPSWTAIYARAQHRRLAWLALGEGLVNLGLSIYWGRQYGVVGVAMGTAVPALIDHLLIIPGYALRVISFPVGDYIRQSVLRPLMASLLFAGFCWLTMDPSGSFLKFVITIICQLVVFAVLAYLVGLSRDDRQLVRELARRRLPRIWFLAAQKG